MRITPKQFAQTLFEITDGKSKSEIEKSVSDFACYIYRNGKLKMAGKIIDQFGKIYNEKNRIIEALVTSRGKLSSSEIEKVGQYVMKKYGSKKVVLDNMADENIKGGVVIKVGDEEADGSVKGKLDELKKILIA